ncbi:MAG: MBL fold metallo-hydrolase [Christensenellaceae bacterium]|jgi:competence protein ComEC|nr:MBL fold metallo-hydrolase [Christensenellaceae bacterium]
MNNREKSNRRKNQSRETHSSKWWHIALIVTLILVTILNAFVFKDAISAMLLNSNVNAPQIDSDGEGNSNEDNQLISETITLNKNAIGVEVHFIDVGQGDAILLRVGTNYILIDAGSGTSSGSATMASRLTTYLSGLLPDLEVPNPSGDIEKLDYMILTHADSDHINLADDVFKNYFVENVYFNDVESTTQVQNTLETAIANELGSNVTAFDPNGRKYSLINDNTYKLILYAPGLNTFDDDNSMSPIIVLEYAGRKVIFTGDATTETEDWFIEQIGKENLSNFDCDVLKIGHHGSSTSTSQKFLEFTTPEFGIISVAESNSYNHPTPFVMNRLFNSSVITYRTNRHGNIALYIDSDGNFAFDVDNYVLAENNRLGKNPLMLKKA